MSKLKEKDGKYYQECEVVMLATKDNTTPLGIDDNSGKLFKFEPKEALWGYQHLYFLSNEKIKEGDWCYNKITKQITQAKTSFYGNFNWVKIIATTDSFLTIKKGLSGIPWEEHLPQPSQSFIQAYIKAYNEGKPITKVLVEYNGLVKHSGGNFVPDKYKLKLNSSNEITIKKIKDSWTREEIEHLLHKCWLAATAKTLEPLIQPGFKTFIEENL